MKITKKITGGIFLLLAILWGCSKDFQEVIKESFPFKIETNYRENTYVFDPVKIRFKIHPEHIVNDNTYFFQYSVEEGEGYFQNKKGEKINQDSSVKIDDLTEDFYWVPTKEGSQVVITKVTDKGSEVENRITINSKTAPFFVDIIKEDDEFISDKDNDFSVIIRGENTARKVGADEKYKVTYQLIEAGKSLIKNDNEIWSMANQYTFKEGVNELKYLPKTDNPEQKIKFNITAPDGARFEKIMDIAIKEHIWKFSTQQKEVNAQLKDTITIPLSIEETEGYKDDYKLKYELKTPAKIEVLQNDVIIKQNNYTNFDEKLKIVPKAIGINTIYLFAKNKKGIVQQDSIQLKVNSSLFSLNAKVPGKMYVDSNNDILFALRSEEDIAYKLSYLGSESGTGDLFNGKKLVVENTPFEVTNRNFILNFVPLNKGKDVLKFKIEDVEGAYQTLSVNINVLDNAITYEVSTNYKETIAREKVAVNVDVLESRKSNTTYELATIIKGGRGQVYDSNGNQITGSVFEGISSGHHQYYVEPYDKGQYVVFFKLKDASGKIYDRSITFNSKTKDFALFAKSDKASYIEKEIPVVNLDIKGGTASDTYRLQYEADKNIELEYNGQKFSMEKTITVNESNFNVKIHPKELGVTNIKFKIINEDDVEKTTSIKINMIEEAVLGKDFIVRVSSDKVTYQVEETPELSFEIKDGIPNDNYSIRYSANANIALEYKGKVYRMNRNIEVDKDNFYMKVLPQEAGNITIKFDVTNSRGVVKKGTVKFNITEKKPKEFEITVGAEKSSTRINLPISVNTTIRELGVTTNEDQYKMYFETDKQGTITYKGNKYIAGELIEIDNTTNKFTYTGKEEGDHNLNIFVISKVTEKKVSKRVLLHYSEKEFEITAVADKGSSTVNVPISINTTIREIGLENNEDQYKMYFETDKQGTITYNGNTYRAGEVFEIDNTTNKLVYTGKEVGNHNVNIYVISKVTEKKANKRISLKYIEKDFNFSATAENKSIFKGGQSKINFEINEVVGTSEKYQLKYKIKSDVSADIFTENGEEIVAGIYQDVNSKQFSWKLVGNNLGKVTVEFTLKNGEGKEFVQAILINVNQKDFIWEASGASNAYVNERIQINANLEELVNGGSYRLYFNSDAAGILYYKGAQIRSGQNVTITPGAFQLEYKGLAVGTHQIDLTVRSDDNIDKKVSLNVNFKKRDFEFNGAPEKNRIFEGERNNINFEIVDAINDSYEIKVENIGSSADGILYDDKGQEVIPNVYKSVSKKRFTYIYTSSKEGSVNLKVTLKNSTGNTKIVSIRFDVPGKDFNFNIIGGGSNYVNELAQLNFELKEIKGNGESYQLYYTPNRDGELYINNVKYNSGTAIPVRVGNTILKYKGKEEGSHNVIFKVVSSKGKEKSKTLNFTFRQKEFDFTAIAEKTGLIKGEDTNINFSVTEEGGTSKYSIYYEMLGSASEETIKYTTEVLTAGVYKEKLPTSFKLNFKDNKPGQKTIRFVLKNDEGVEKTKTVRIKISEEDFNFNVINPKPVIVGNTAKLNYSLTEIGNKTPVYQVKYTATGNGTLSYKGNVKQPNSWFDVEEGNGNDKYFEYTSDDVGKQDITFTIKSSKGVEKTVDNRVDFRNEAFTVDLITPTPLSTDRINKGKEFVIQANIKTPIKSKDTDTKYYLNIKEKNGVNIKYRINNGQTIYQNGNKIEITNSNNSIYCRIDGDFNGEKLDFDVRVENTTGVKYEYNDLNDVRVYTERYIELKYNEKNFWYGIYHCNDCNYTNDAAWAYIKPNSISYIKDDEKDLQNYNIVIELLLDNENAEGIYSKKLQEAFTHINSRQSVDNDFSNVNENGQINNKQFINDECIWGKEMWKFKETKYKKGLTTPFAKYRIKVMYNGVVEYEKTISPKVKYLNRNYKLIKDYN